MATLSVSNRRKYFAILGLGEYNDENVLKLQKKYFSRKSDCDGKYGVNTDKLLVNLYNVTMHAPHFKLTEFKCHCNGKYCTGYPVYISKQLLINLEKVRVKFGATTVSSGIRCIKWNSMQTGSASQSKHTQGKAVDIYGSYTKSSSGRNKVKAYWYTLTGANYCYHGTKNMGTAVHMDVK